VSIPDPNLRTAVEGALNKNAGEAILRSELAGLTTLRGYNRGIANLTGLEHATGLTTLTIAANTISDISALSGLTQLETLNLNRNSITDLSPLSGLTALRSLRLNSNSISDIAPLAANTGLGSGDSIDLRANANTLNAAAYSTHIPALQGRGVTVQFDPAPAVSIPDTNLRTALESALNKNAGEVILRSELAGLTTLRASNDGITHLTGLEQATGLTQLFLDTNSISDISDLSGLTRLEMLNLNSNSISDIAPLAANTGLGSGDSIDLRGNSLNPAAYSTHIPALERRGVTVQFDPAPAVFIPDPNLRTVLESALNKNAGDMILRFELAGLTSLRANNTGISNLTGLEQATSLTQLFLGRNSISNISALSGLTSLTSLNLSVNIISDIAPLAANTGLGSGDTIDLRGNTLNAAAYSTHIPDLQGRGVTVQFNPNPTLRRVVSICDRTDVVEAAILARIGARIGASVACGEVTNLQLAAISSLDLANRSLTTLQSGDFAGLTSLGFLDFGGNRLTRLPENVFNGLNNLEELYFGFNRLTSLPEDVFDRLTNLAVLDLNNNSLGSLPENVFDDLTNLGSLDLGNNRLTSLPEDVFDRLASLAVLHLNDNRLTSLPGDVFDGLASLELLRLDSNRLTSLPQNVFNDLNNLHTLRLNFNRISDLTPLSGLTALSWLGLESTGISDIAPLVANSGLGSGDTINLVDNVSTLNAATYSTHIPALQRRGVTVYFGSRQLAGLTLSPTALNVNEAGVTVSPTALNVNEAGGTKTYTIMLNSQPTADVTVTPTSQDRTIATVSAPLTFTPGNWNQPQTITVTGIDDHALNAPPRSTQVTHTVSGGGYNGITVENVSITTLEEVVAISIHAVELSVTEGTPIQFQLTATPTPIADLVVPVTIADPDGVLAEAAPTEVMIPANQSTFMLELDTDDDEVDELNATVTVTLEEPSDGNYTVAAAPDNRASIQVMDNDGLTRERRERGIKHALGAFGRVAGWDLVEAIRNRSRNSIVQGKAFEITNLPTFGVINMGAPGSSIKLSSIDLSELLDSEIRIAFNPRVAQTSASESSGKSPLVRAWINASKTDVESHPFEHQRVPTCAC